MLHAGTPRWSRPAPRWRVAGRNSTLEPPSSAGGNSTLEPPSSTLERGLLAGTPRWSRPAPRWSGVCWRELHAGAAQLHAGTGSAGGNSTLEPPSSTLERGLPAGTPRWSRPAPRWSGSAGGNSTLEPPSSTLERGLLAGTPRWSRPAPRWSGICRRELCCSSTGTVGHAGAAQLHAGAGSAGGNSTLEPPSSTLERGLLAGTPRWSRPAPRWSGVCWRELHAGAAQLHAGAGSAGGNSTLEPPSSTLERGLLAGTPRWTGWNRCSGICWRELHAGAVQLHAVAGSLGGNSTLGPRSSTL